MLTLDNVKTYGWETAIRGMRNPLESWDKMDSSYSPIELGPNDYMLFKNLISAGPSHRKFLRQIFIGVDITAPDYWWKEFDTYKVGTTANSTSTMHKVMSKPFTADMFSWECLPEQSKEYMLNLLNSIRDRYLGEEKKRTKQAMWKELIQSLPMSWNYTRTVTLNYEVFLIQYEQRCHHKLTEWHQYLLGMEAYLEYMTKILDFLGGEE